MCIFALLLPVSQILKCTIAHLQNTDQGHEIQFLQWHHLMENYTKDSLTVLHLTASETLTFKIVGLHKLGEFLR